MVGRSVLVILVSAALLATGLLASASLFPTRSALERALVALLFAHAAAIGLVEMLALFDAIARPGLVASAVVLAALTILGTGAPAMTRVRDDLGRLGAVLAGAATSPTLAVSLLVALVVLALATSAAWLLAPWAWESLAYHLAVSSDAIQSHTLREVPTHVVYARSYPHLGAVFLTAHRLALGDDALAETMQIPFVSLAVTAITLAARREGVSTRRALAFGLLFVATPAVALELASAEVDVMFASLVLTAFVLATGPLDAPTIGLAGLALGLALGTDPSSPLVVATGFLLLAVRGVAARRAGEVFFAAGVVASVGGWSYLENLVLHGNPLWPVRVDWLGLEGLASPSELATRGSTESFASGSWAERLDASWLSPFEPRPSYDMRRGGLGPVWILGLLPIALAASIAAARDAAFRDRIARVAVFAVPLAFATLAAPHAFWGRYTVAIVGAGLAVAAVATRELRGRWQRAIDVSLVVLAIASAWHTSTGFTVDGPSLTEVAAMPEAERGRAYGIDLDEGPWHDARASIAHGEAFAYDASFTLPGRLFAPHQHGRVVYLDEATPTAESLVRFVDEERVRWIVLGEAPFLGAALARQHPERFREAHACSPSLGDPCALFEVRPAP
jgi:hypothetical protein